MSFGGGVLGKGSFFFNTASIVFGCPFTSPSPSSPRLSSCIPHPNSIPHPHRLPFPVSWSASCDSGCKELLDRSSVTTGGGGDEIEVEDDNWFLR